MTIEFSYGKAEDDSAFAPIRIDSGEFAGTVFRFDKIQIKEDGSVSNQISLDLFIRNGTINESPSKLAIEDLKPVVWEILLLMLSDMKHE